MTSPANSNADTETTFQPAYIGRFAPSPSGPLHLGSLVAALASWLDAKKHNGQWLLRMEDIDPPREQAGASDAILHCLEAHQLTWDGAVLYQSQRHQAYRDQLHALQQQGLLYRCRCGRQQLRAMPNGVYDGRCRHLNLPEDIPCSIRLNLEQVRQQGYNSDIHFDDLFQRHCHSDLQQDGGDFIVHRKDGLFAYQLAVVVDDIYQGISHVIRGVDLLDATPRQLLLFDLCGQPAPQYGHIPVVCNAAGDKLSKQTKAPALDDRQAPQNLLAALQFLLPQAPGDLASCEYILEWGLLHWQDFSPKPQHPPLLD